MPFHTDQPSSAVFALHGSASAGAQWRRLAAALADRFRFCAPDRPGYGAAQGDNRSSAEAVREALGAMGGAPVHLVGHSYGAAILLKLALDNPEGVASLTLIEPTAMHLLRDQPVASDRRLFQEIAALSRAVADGVQVRRPEIGVARFVDYWNGAGAWARMQPALQSRLLQQASAVARDFAEEFAETWPLIRCARLTCPTLVLRGSVSRGPALRVSALVADVVPGAQSRGRHP